MRGVAILVILVVGICGAVVLNAQEPARIALLIGNQAYVDKVGALKNPHKDVARVAASLKRLGFKVTVVKDAGYRAMDGAVRRYVDRVRRAGPGTISFFYYSGHGAANPENHVNYLIPVDVTSADTTELWFQSFEQSGVTDRLSEQAPRATHFVIFDACRNELNVTGSLKKGLGDEKGFVPVNDVRGMLIAYATEEKRTASDSGKFAEILAEELPKKGVEAVEMFRRVQLRVQETQQQAPWMSLRYMPRVYLGGASEGGTPEAEAAVPKLPVESTVKPAVGTYASDAAALKVGESFRDCRACPEMVVVPAGSFMMGSPPDEPQRQSNEGPQHKVTFRQPFAVGKYAVTFAEWDACVDDGGCGGYKPRDQGWGRGSRPVIHVSWEDAQAYVKWLSTKTGKNYRLLSEAEWEYMARAGTNTPFWWGTTITSEQANYDGQFKYAGSSKGLNRRQTIEVDKFQPNQWGLFQVHGNVWEWTKDCWFEQAKIQPNGEQTQNVGCTNGAPRVMRGGAWNVSPEYLRSASRISGDPVRRFAYLGFRIGSDLKP